MLTAGTPQGPAVPGWVAPVTLQQLVDAAVINSGGPTPRRYNQVPLWVSESGNAETLLAALDQDLTTPESAQIGLLRSQDVDRLVSPNPGIYKWGLFALEENLGTAPATPLAARLIANTGAALSGSAMMFGDNVQGHALELTVGARQSEATVNMTIGEALLTNIIPTKRGSRFVNGMPLKGAGIPAGAKIGVVTARPGSPTQFTMVQADGVTPALATANGVAVAITAQPVGTLETIAGLITGAYGTVDGGGNPAGAGLQFSSYNDYSRLLYGLNFGASSLLATGKAMRLASLTAARALSVESSALDEGVAFSNTAFANAGLYFGPGVSGQYGLRFSSDGAYSIAAVYLPGQSIGTDTSVGLKLTTNVNQKWAAHGRTPVAIATISGSRGAATVAVLQSLLTALHAKGIITDSTTA